MSAPVKILHVADVHLDRPFVGLTLDDARARRRELREALDRCLDVARAHAVDAITIGGDLWEDEHVTPDTCRWVADRLENTGLPVVIIAGNHDPLRPGGPHQRVSWPTNVRVLPVGPDLTRHELDGVSVWGMSWGTVPLTADTLRTFSVPEDGASHVLVLHGTAGGAAFNDGAHCPFTAAAVRNAGFELCLAGHLHAGGVRDDVVVYPGSPEPLAWDETGRHAVALVEFNVGTSPRVQLLDVNTRRYAQTVVDCDGAHSSADVERALSDAVSVAAADGGPEGLCLRAILRGRLDPACRIDARELAATNPGLTLLDLRNETQPAFDLDALSGGPTALSSFVRDLRGRIEECDADDAQRKRLELALDLGLRAMHGDDLEYAT